MSRKQAPGIGSAWAALCRTLPRAACAAAAIAATPGSAQQSGLRGGVDEANIVQELVSPATGAEAGITGSIFTDPGQPEDPFADAPVPMRHSASAARPRGASASGIPQQRRQQADGGLHSGDAQTTGTFRVLPGNPDRESELSMQLENQRVRAIEGLPRQREENPYEPLGLRVGSFVVNSSLEQGLGWTSNVDSSPDGAAAVLSDTTLRLEAISDWSRHSAAASAYGTFRKTVSGAQISEPQGGIDGDIVLELGNHHRAAAAVRYDVRRESATSPVDLPPTTSRPLRHTLTGNLGLSRTLGKFRFGIEGKVERLMYDSAKLEGGGALSQRERDSTLTSVLLRGGYELSPAVIPFAEAEIGRRNHDLRLDSSGYARSANRFGARAGLALDMGEKLSGELAAGWVTEVIDDARLESISGATIAADVLWSPVRGTRVGMNAATEVEGTTTPDESGSVLYSAQLSVERELRANLTGTTAFGAQWRDYQGNSGYDLTVSAEAGFTWWLNRYAGLTGRARHETLKSNLPNRDSETTSLFMGVKLQR
jgi:hypothetical protein